MKPLYPNFRPSRAVLVIAVLIVVLICGVWGTRWVHYRLTHVTTDDARVAGEVITLSSRVNGWVTGFPVIEGDTIKAGQVLVTFDDRDTRLQRAALVAQLDSAQLAHKAQSAQVVQTSTSTHGDLAAARGKLDSAEASRAAIAHRLEQARADYKRTEDLAKRHFLSPQALDQARTTLAQSEDQLRQADAEIRASQGSLASSQGQMHQVPLQQAKLDASQADIDQIKARIAELDAQLDDRVIKSPVNGHVVQTFIRKNEYALTSQRLLMVHNPDDQWIEANIKETDIAAVSVGQKVDIRASAYPDKVFRGTVARLGGAATSQFALLPDPNPSGNFTKITQRLPVRIAFDTPVPGLHPGMMVEVAIDQRSH